MVKKSNEVSETGTQLVTAKIVAARYSVSERSVLNWKERGIIPHIRIGDKTIRFNMAEVIAALEGGAH
jgi:hypothetical protein